ncbi:MAG: hypothetical protein JWN48_4454 [Myxococcaceae bacterium]|nr:hypothetical protein [Myxococcaceae bacterium]
MVVTLRNSVVPAALALAGCLPSESEPPPAVSQTTYQTELQGGECKVEQVVYEIHGSVYPVPSDAHALNKSSSPAGSLLVTVGESTSVVSCGVDSVRVASPGAELTNHAFSSDASEFSLTVPGVIIGGQRPELWIQALLDSNDNGECDEGELSGSVNLAASELGDMAIELSDEGCPARS